MMIKLIAAAAMTAAFVLPALAAPNTSDSDQLVATLLAEVQVQVLAAKPAQKAFAKREAVRSEMPKENGEISACAPESAASSGSCTGNLDCPHYPNHCIRGTCATGYGDCEENSDCPHYPNHCVRGSCANGSAGDVCAGNDDCVHYPNKCVRGTCAG